MSIEVWSGISGLFGLHANEECVQSNDKEKGYRVMVWEVGGEGYRVMVWEVGGEGCRVMVWEVGGRGIE